MTDGDDGGKKNELTTTRPASRGRGRPASRNSNRDNTTQRSTLRELARIPPRPATPLRRASSLEPASARRSSRRTPAGVNSVQKPTTPHARAAMREIEARRAAVLTPGRERRRSLGRQQKETPMGAMRALSRLLAPNTNVPTPSPSRGAAEEAAARSTKRSRDFEDFDEEPLPRPRMSMALDDYDEDDSLILPPPPNSAGLEDDNYTARSIEVPRRAVSEQTGGRYSRGSFGDIGSDDRLQAFGGFDFNALEEDGIDSSFIPQEYGDDYGENRRYSGIPREDTGTVQLDVPDDINRRMSDFRRAALQNDNTDTSFMIAVPPRDEVSANNFNFGVEGMEDLTFDAVQDTPRPMGYDEEEDVLPDIEEDEQQEEEIEPEQDLENEEPEEEPDAQDEETQILNNTLMIGEDADEAAGEWATANQKKKSKRKVIKVSKHGIPVPSLPVGVVKKMATNFARMSGNSKAKLNKDAMAAIMQATDWFFEQASADLGAYAEHAGRKTIDESDVITLMKR